MAVPYRIEVLLLLLSIATNVNYRLCMGELNVICKENERKALLSFKRGLSDPSNRLSSWSDKEDCRRWPGVRCDNITGRVEEVKLSTPLNSPYVELGGEISTSLLELRSLTHLDLSLNYFVHSQIPKFLGSMEDLLYLDLSYSGMSGLIPRELGNLSKL
ncbi:hypothetical protein L6164_008354 [Bauhinia variegata]|uniref:Uncharacterized protein n=1 Tax=Bauhinia variegata TaxID=167791 RepID=A0ACB9PFC2_BAUVA|nr:hypothetical protein L6164_008354 [Bauhinia variegata]